MPEVKAKEGESFESTWRRFRRLVEKNNVLAELRRRAHYKKPSAQRQLRIAAAKKRLAKRLLREKQAMERDRRH